MPKLPALIFLTLPLLCQAEIYKWVDARGVAHYTDNKDEAGQAQVTEIKPNAAPAPALPQGVTWQQREAEFRRLQQHKLMAPAYKAPRAKPQPVNPSRPYYSTEVATDQSRCELARDIASGAATRLLGAPTDSHDRTVAAQDIRAFCH
jgi:hypothetical protein